MGGGKPEKKKKETPKGVILAFWGGWRGEKE